MQPVMHPAAMNGAFAQALNSGKLENLLALYEDDALLCTDDASRIITGKADIARTLKPLLDLRGTMTSRNVYCLIHGDIALLRADWHIEDDAGHRIAAGSSAEVCRRQPDGTWRYLIDHAVGASLPGIPA